ncbi:MAG: anhydro-N-acetylmuramic acid kinase [Eudoraea sp.]|nr:anhydro-N-acetylmuramic acid kinase [Eudoraea sp.]
MKVHKVIGVMSGTSLDGLDMAYCHIWKKQETWEFDIKHSSSIPYDTTMQKKLQGAIELPADQLLSYHNSYGSWLGNQIKMFAENAGLQVDYVASHGHTIHHKPEDGITFQLGEGQHVANASGFKTICDFRTNDVALGGQGAPLVPIGDQLLFKSYDFCLNLGGISNISFELNNQRFAFDIGIANMILNHITRQHGLPYDDGGKLAKKGTILPGFLAQLNALDYYTQPYPKSTGYEWFAGEILPILNSVDAPKESLLHTSIVHICEQVAMQVKALAGEGQHTLLVTGGGALNTFMMEVLQDQLGDTIRVVIPNKQLIEFKEALVFAFMGVLRSEHEINVLHTVTGAKTDSSSGVVFLPS